jgi:hypothetical protein
VIESPPDEEEEDDESEFRPLSIQFGVPSADSSVLPPSSLPQLTDLIRFAPPFLLDLLVVKKEDNTEAPT